ncbi:ricin-type beta-trefoil lectin domain protein [Micromonospora robiginosa]|uniref:Ricin-type beta-trefoil lectin domain protein n=1 Tax=Micromonospora robiginosa TaxID=2749844 RepID=A0A7L6B392_9ACTN|nr:ricin-type beta-trefoil lectin domain protein [Micromonospora ferruginea]QLQ36443.1 ricin-type beta-trefoil lectin domain protein [Micromonospora ferruginea]
MTPDLPGIRSRLARIPRRVVAAIAAGLAVLFMVIASVSWGIATARDDKLTGRTVSAEHLTAIRAAARSCPTLTPARLAGQLMTESGLDGRVRKTTSGGRGFAGLDDAGWKSWAPWPDADRTDAAANILALAHQMCDLSGQLRLAGIPGDQWRLSLAAFHTGLDQVREAKGVPSGAVEYVDDVSRYAAYYGELTAFGGSGTTGGEPERRQPKAVPGGYVRLVVRAGSVCPEVPPAAVAAQLMALSGFDPNLLGDDGRRGIAQFLPEVWRAHGPAGASPWDPQVAVPAAGVALCALRRDLAGLDGDPGLLALAAYRNGPTALRQTGGELDDATQAYLRQVREFTDFYALDGRLRVPSASPSPSPASPSPSPSPSAGSPLPRPSVSPSTRPPAEPEKPAPPKRPSGAKQLVGKETGLCATGGTGDGVRVVLRPCKEHKLHWWTFPSDGSVRVNGLCLDVAWGEKRDGAPVQTAFCSGNPAQKWEWIERDGRRSLFNRETDRCLDVDGHGPDAPLNAWTCVFNPKQTWSLR